jgi:RimJ/RimL family protein N-acetyltransferase
MENLFRSARLSYRAVEDTPEDEALFHAIQSDVVAYANSDSSVLKPQTKKESSNHKNYVQSKTLLGVVICLEAPRSSPPTLPTAPPISIGSIYLTAPKSGEEHHRNAYISVDILAPYQRKGYGSEAIEWALDWGFRMAGLHRIGIEAFSYNVGAKQLYERLGFVYEGCKRGILWYNGGWHDFIMFGMLEGEWRERQSRKNKAQVTVQA